GQHHYCSTIPCERRFLMHLRPEVSLDVIEGRATSADVKAVTEHIEDCLPCSQLMSEWRRVHALFQGSHLQGAPTEFLDRAGAIFDTWPEKRTTIGEILAAVIFDSHA